MTERLYYHDPYSVEFEAEIVEHTTHEGKAALVLERTAFYPTSGGQPFDTGSLSGARVLEVVDTDDGRILHVVDRAPQGSRVRGTIDWDRRFDHMQQHTGQHVLSAAFDRFLTARTESFHLGAEYSTIDLDRQLPASAIERLQAEGRETRRQIKEFQVKLAAQEADALAAAAEDLGSLRLVAAVLPGWDASGLKAIAARIAERAGHAAVLLGDPAPAAIVIARGTNVAVDAGAVLKALLARHGGKGGGRPEMAQGGGITSAAADVLQSARDLLTAKA